MTDAGQGLNSGPESSVLIKCDPCGVLNRLRANARGAKCGSCGSPLQLPAVNVATPQPSSPAQVKGTQSPMADGSTPVSEHPLSSSAGGEHAFTQKEATRPSNGIRKTHRSILIEEIKGSNAGTGWILAAVLGAIAITALRGAGGSVRLVAPCGIMLAYFAWGWCQQSRNNEKLADSLYFLGFIWTLYALIDALVASNSTAPDAPKLFMTFGYALVTTGLGMFLRMVVIQLEYSAPEQIRDARNAVSEGLDQFKVRLDEAQAALAISRQQFQQTTQLWLAVSKETSQVMQDASRQTAEQARAAVQQVVAGLGDTNQAVKDSAEGTKAAARAVTTLAKRVVAAGEKFDATLTAASDSAVAGLHDAARKLRVVEFPTNMLSTHFEQLALEMTTPTRDVLKAVEQVSVGLQATAAKLNAIELPPSLLAKQVEELAGEILQPSAKLLRSVEDMSAAARAMQEELARVASGAADRIRDTAGAADTARKSVVALESSSNLVNSSLVSIGAITAEWSTSATKVIQAQAALVQSIESLDRRLGSVTEHLAARGVVGSARPRKPLWRWKN
jgi:hypothetical protein